MGRIVKVKNTGAKETWFGWAIASGTYFQIPPLALESWAEDSHVYGSVVSGTLVVNDGTSDFGDPVAGWDWLVGNNVEAIVISGTATCTGTINLVGADGANISAVGDTITIHGGGSQDSPIYFSGIDSAGLIDISSGFTDITLDTEHAKTGITHSADSAEVTIDTTGAYAVTYHVGNIETTSTPDRASSEARLMLDTGAGYAEVKGTRGHMYHRNNSSQVSAKNSCSCTVILDLTAGDKLKIQAQKFQVNTSTIKTAADACGLSVRKI